MASGSLSAASKMQVKMQSRCRAVGGAQNSCKKALYRAIPAAAEGADEADPVAATGPSWAATVALAVPSAITQREPTKANDDRLAIVYATISLGIQELAILALLHVVYTLSKYCY